MCSKVKHAKRSHRSYYRRLAAARWYCNYNTTKEERLLMKAAMQRLLYPQQVQEQTQSGE